MRPTRTPRRSRAPWGTARGEPLADPRGSTIARNSAGGAVMLRSWWRRTVRQRKPETTSSGRGPVRRAVLALEALEGRDVPSVVQPTYVTFHPAGASPLGSPGPVGYTPAQVRHAYGFDQIVFGGGIVGDGSGQTIAIIDAYDDPNIASDLHQFDLAFGLPDPAFTKV